MCVCGWVGGGGVNILYILRTDTGSVKLLGSISVDRWADVRSAA